MNSHLIQNNIVTYCSVKLEQQYTCGCITYIDTKLNNTFVYHCPGHKVNLCKSMKLYTTDINDIVLTHENPLYNNIKDMFVNIYCTNKIKYIKT